jgi:hypothetical protein
MLTEKIPQDHIRRQGKASPWVNAPIRPQIFENWIGPRYNPILSPPQLFFIKRADPDSVKGWFVTKLLTPYLVSTACGKPG